MICSSCSDNRSAESRARTTSGAVFCYHFFTMLSAPACMPWHHEKPRSVPLRVCVCDDETITYRCSLKLPAPDDPCIPAGHIVRARAPYTAPTPASVARLPKASVRLTWDKPGHLTLTLRDSDTTAARIDVPVTSLQWCRDGSVRRRGGSRQSQVSRRSSSAASRPFANTSNLPRDKPVRLC